MGDGFKEQQTKPPFNMLIVGMANSGKTKYLLDMIDRDYRGHFEYIYIVCPTLKWNRKYQEWSHINDTNVIKIECEQDDVDKYLKEISLAFRGRNALIIVDDCAASNRTSELVKLAFSARHFGISMIVTTQQLTSIPKPYRDTCAKIVTF